MANRTGRKPDLHWVGLFAAGADDAIGASQAVVGAAKVSGRHETILRIRGNYGTFLGDTGAANGDTVRVAAGLLLITSGGTSASLPIDDPDAPWIWYDTVVLSRNVETASGALTRSHTIVVDNKAMRIIRGDQDLVFVVQSVDVAGAPTIGFNFAARMLMSGG